MASITRVPSLYRIGTSSKNVSVFFVCLFVCLFFFVWLVFFGFFFFFCLFLFCFCLFFSEIASVFLEVARCIQTFHGHIRKLDWIGLLRMVGASNNFSICIQQELRTHPCWRPSASTTAHPYNPLEASYGLKGKRHCSLYIENFRGCTMCSFP